MAGVFSNVIRQALHPGSKIVLKTLAIALCIAGIGLGLFYVKNRSTEYEAVLRNFSVKPEAFAALQTTLMFILVFRTSQSISRYMSACTYVREIQGGYWNAACSICNFASLSDKSKEKALDIKREVVVLMSLLNAACLHNVHTAGQDTDASTTTERAECFPVVGVGSLSAKSTSFLRAEANKPDLLFHWVEMYVLDKIKSGILSAPPPILNGAFLQLYRGRVQYEDCMKLALISIPRPYSTMAAWLLLFHLVLTPVQVIQEAIYVSTVVVYTMLPTFTFWTLYCVSEELENPFGGDDLDLDLPGIQENMNTALHLLLREASHNPPTFDNMGEAFLEELDSTNTNIRRRRLSFVMSQPDGGSSSDSDSQDGKDNSKRDLCLVYDRKSAKCEDQALLA